MPVSHLDMFYDTRQSLHVSRSSPANNPNTELPTVPEEVEIRFESGVTREINCNTFESPEGKGFRIARFLIGRAMLDPDATVVKAGK